MCKGLCKCHSVGFFILFSHWFTLLIAVTHAFHDAVSVFLFSSGNILKVISFSGSSFPFPFTLHAALSATEKIHLFRFALKFIQDELLFFSLITSNMMVDHEQQLLTVWRLLFQGVPLKRLVAVWGGRYAHQTASTNLTLHRIPLFFDLILFCCSNLPHSISNLSLSLSNLSLKLKTDISHVFLFTCTLVEGAHSRVMCKANDAFGCPYHITWDCKHISLSL